MVRIDRIGETERKVQSAFSTTAPQRARVCAIILVLFVAAATFNAFRKDVSHGFDELAHASYVAHLQSTGESWPDLNQLRMLDPITFHFTDNRNYLSHPAPYYLFLAKLGPRLENAPSSIIAHRLLNVLLAAIGFGALLMISVIIPLNKLSLYAYLVPLATIPVLARLPAPSTMTIWHWQEAASQRSLVCRPHRGLRLHPYAQQQPASFWHLGQK